MVTLLKSAENATAPWNSMDSFREADARRKLPGDFVNDSKAEIERCLHCPYEDCDGLDCMDAWKKILVIRKVKHKPGRKRKK